MNELELQQLEADLPHDLLAWSFSKGGDEAEALRIFQQARLAMDRRVEHDARQVTKIFQTTGGVVEYTYHPARVMPAVVEGVEGYL